MNLKIALTATCGVLLYASTLTFATVLTSPASFGPTTVTETFENITGRGNNFRFGTSLTLPSQTALTVSSSADSTGPYVVNGGFFGLEAASPSIPSGTAYLGQENPSASDNGLFLTFPADQLRVGLKLALDASGATNAPLVLEAYNVNNVLLATTTVRGYTVDNWRNQFIGFEGVGNIRRLRLDGFGVGVLRVDDVMSQAVPEPSAGLLVAVAGFFVGRRRDRSR